MRLNSGCKDALAWHIYQLQLVIENANEFDIIHFHNDYLHFPISKILKYSHITTLHGRLDIPELTPLYKKFPGIPVVSISNNQRKPLSHINWISTVYHGIPENMYQAGNGKGNYLAFLGEYRLKNDQTGRSKLQKEQEYL
jgi:hypothetical protein